MNGAALLRFCAFVKERESVRVRKERGDLWPWTKDPILRAYRFCNIRREHDKETRLIFDNWLRPHGRTPDVWFAAAVARLVNWWPSLEAVGYPVPWGAGRPRFEAALTARLDAGEKLFTGAYMVHADPHVSGRKHLYLAEQVLTPLWDARKALRPREGDTLAAFHERLITQKDIGTFVSGQIIADAKFFDTNLLLAEDRSTWAVDGPGSRRGLARLMGYEPTHNWGRGAWAATFRELQTVYNNPFKLDGQNLQNCLCEFDKHERVRLGQGVPRSKYSYQPVKPTKES